MKENASSKNLNVQLAQEENLLDWAEVLRKFQKSKRSKKGRKSPKKVKKPKKPTFWQHWFRLIMSK